MPIKICLAGANGHVGRELVKSILDKPEFELTACTGLSSAGKSLSSVLNFPCPDIIISGSVDDALNNASFDILIDYTAADAVYKTILQALGHKIHCVIGTSGLSDAQYEEINSLAMAQNVGVFAAGNFSVTATLLLHFSKIAAKFIPTWELLDYASDTKKDAPSGTSRELAFELSKIAESKFAVSPEKVKGHPQSRGYNLNGSQVHSLRVPGFYSSAEAVFGLPGERLSLRHDSISYSPYVEGTLLAVKKVQTIQGLVRGMDKLLGLEE